MIEKIIIIIISFILFRFISFIEYNLNIYKWHCENIFPFNKYFTLNEKKYIDLSLKLSFLELFRPFLGNVFVYQLSFFSYSTEIRRENINSSRIAYGTTVASSYFYEYAKKVLKERNIKPPVKLDKDTLFGGLGWDFKNRTFKIYFRFRNKRYFPLFLKPKQEKILNKQGILSFSYDFSGNLIEKKIYLYPINNSDITLLISNKRKEKQMNIKNKEIEYELNDIGKKIIGKYKKNDYDVDTINYRNYDNFILYFPKMN